MGAAREFTGAIEAVGGTRQQPRLSLNPVVEHGFRMISAGIPFASP